MARVIPALERMKMKLIREFYELCPDGICNDYLSEEEKKLVVTENKVFLAGLIQQAGIENGNGRVYPRRVLEKEVKNYQKLVKERIISRWNVRIWKIKRNSIRIRI